MQRVSAEVAGHFQYGRQLVRIVARDGGIDLDGDAFRLQVLHAVNSGIERSRDAAECIMGGGVRAVERDGDALDADLFDLRSDVFRDQRAVSSQSDPQAAAVGVFSKLKNVAAVQGLAAAEHEDGVPEIRDLGDDVERFFGRQIVRRHQLGRGGAAVDATQVTTLGDLPENQPRRVFLARRVRTPITLCHLAFPPPALAELRLVSMSPR